MAITLLDGGMGQELIARTGVATPMWATQALVDNPALVRTVHDEYFAAGAEIATANTYALLPDRLEHYSIMNQFDSLHRLACQLAVDARDAHGSGRVAGSLGPQGYSYRPELCPPAAEAAENYAKICEVQQEFVDLFIAETMSSVDQVRGALMGSAGFGKPVWIALSVDDSDGTRLRSGEVLTDVLPLIKEFEPAAVLINCSMPEAVCQAVPQLTGNGFPVGAYANGFLEICDEFNSADSTVDLLSARTDLDPAAYANFAARWIADGASIIGGCCEVGPAHIAELHSRYC